MFVNACFILQHQFAFSALTLLVWHQEEPVKNEWWGSGVVMSGVRCNHHTTTTVLRPFFWDHPGELVPEESHQVHLTMLQYYTYMQSHRKYIHKNESNHNSFINNDTLCSKLWHCWTGDEKGIQPV